jgi:hypothetical protein
MSEQVQQNLKVTDQGAEKTVQKTPEAIKDGGVIVAQPNQEVHGQAFEQAHRNDKTLSEPDMIAMNDGETVAEYKARVAQVQANRFGFFDSEDEKRNDAGAGVAGGTKIHEHPAKQAVEPLPTLSPTMQQQPFDSSVKANVQITNVPEVSEAVQQEVLGKYAEAVLENAAAAVRQIENHLAQPNAINSDFLKLGQLLAEGPGHFAQSPEQLNKDVSAITTGAMEEIDKPLTVDERAKKAGILLPMFFFEGGKEPINPETIEQMGLEGMTEAELKALGIEKRVTQIAETEIRETIEALEIAQQKLIAESVEEKLTKYLLEPSHRRQKAKWFESVLGFTMENRDQLARQIKLEPKYLRPSQSNDWGIMYEQPTTIIGANGRVLENCKIYWLQDSETGLFEFKNLLLQKKK